MGSLFGLICGLRLVESLAVTGSRHPITWLLSVWPYCEDNDAGLFVAIHCSEREAPPFGLSCTAQAGRATAWKPEDQG